MAGDTATHDRIVGEALTNKLPWRGRHRSGASVDGSGARALPAGAVLAPVFASPELGIKFTRDVLSGAGAPPPNG